MIDALIALVVLVPDDTVIIITWCRDLEPWSFWWIYHYCWMFGSSTSNAVAAGASAAGALLSAKVLRWFVGAR